MTVEAESIIERGRRIASQSWSGGSWAEVFVLDGVFYVLDEVELSEFEGPQAAFERAGIGRATLDSILTMNVDPEFEQYILSEDHQDRLAE